MSWSLNEIQSLARKAARGAGFSWGLADEAGIAVRLLQAANAPGARALAQYLETLDAEASSGSSSLGMILDDRASCPIALGASLMDGGVGFDRLPCHVRQPLLLVPAIAFAAGRDCLRITWEGAEICVDAASGTPSILIGNSQTSALLADEALCACEKIAKLPGEAVSVTRIADEEKSVIERLEKFAHRTYAPATEQSRLAGAGAGLSDND